MNGKVLALLGFAAKSGALVFGVRDCVDSVKQKKAKGVFFAADISAKSRKEILFHCDKFGIRAFELDVNSEQLSHAVGRKCSGVAVTNDNFYNPIVTYLSGRKLDDE